MMETFFTNSNSEKKFGYCRALSVDGWVFVSGTAGADFNTGEFPADIEGQARQMVSNVEYILKEAGSGLHDVVMRSIYLADPKDTPTVWGIVNEKMSHSPANQGLSVNFLADPIKVYMSVIARKGAGTPK
ncbi:enamine deaminase RidA (YjgF/YER057c/UK114 family) [Caballeronia udeis]|uniref:Enamine deaminase RidA (YjgF/YER057c/UK114 family) n=1 Tax=Caballeronia udeis TaxID=1232866 RepID=A0ABW8MYX9_9BURK